MIPLRHLLIRASAGSGKTYQLTNRFIGLLCSGVDPGKILAVTFTRKAAGEILRRILQRLLEALEEDSKRTELSAALVECGFPAVDRAGVESALENLISRFHRLRVSTLDAFFGQIASAFALECQLPLAWSLLEEDRLARIRTAAIASLLEQSSPGDASVLMHRLSKGDSRRPVADEIDSIVGEFHGVWSVTSTGAWQVPPLLPTVSEAEIEKATARIEKMEIPLTKEGRERKAWATDRLRILETASQQRWVDLFSKGLPSKFLEGPPVLYSSVELEEKAVIEALETLRSQARSVLSRIIASQNEATENLLRRYDHQRSALLIRTGGVGFGDITRSIAQSKALQNLDEVFFRLDGQIDHLLLDEFQDTSLIQWWILESVVDELVADPSGSRSVFCVGDGKQAIHGWRGGRREVLGAIEERLPAGCVETLDRSWRSSPVILEVVNQVFGTLTSRDLLADESPAMMRWLSDFNPHEAAHPQQKGYVQLRITGGDEDRPPRDEALVEAVDEVERIHRNFPGASIGVLLRKGKDRIAPIVAALRERGIEASEEGGNPLVDSPAVGRITALLELIEHPADGPSHLAVINSPLPRILEQLGAGTEDEWRSKTRAGECLSSLREKIQRSGLVETLIPIVDGLWLLCEDRDRRRLGQLIELLRYFPHRGIRLAEVIQRIHKRPVPAPTGATIQVMTIHRAKGLEFDAVILPDLFSSWFKPQANLFTSGDPGIAPPSKIGRSVSQNLVRLVGEPYLEMRQQTREATVEEALSLLYVAMTRARHHLQLLLPRATPGKTTVKRSWESASAAEVLWQTLSEDPDELESLLVGGNVIYQRGEADALGAVERSTQPPLQLASVIGQLKSNPDGRRTRTSSPSGAHRSTGPNLASMISGRSSRSRAVGTLVHRAFEEIIFLDGSVDQTLIGETLAQEYPRFSRHFEESLALFSDALQGPGISALLEEEATRVRLDAGDGDSIRIENELPIATIEDGKLMRGYIDRLALLERDGIVVSAELIDWKTDQVDSAGGSAERLEYHRGQLEAYRQAVCATFKLPPEKVAARLALVRSGEVQQL